MQGVERPLSGQYERLLVQVATIRWRVHYDRYLAFSCVGPYWFSYWMAPTKSYIKRTKLVRNGDDTKKGAIGSGNY